MTMLQESAVATLVAFVLFDIGSALCLLAGILAFGVDVNADFALAYVRDSHPYPPDSHTIIHAHHHLHSNFSSSNPETWTQNQQVVNSGAKKG